MALLTPSRSIQYPMVAEFTFGYDDLVTNDAGAPVDFGATNTAETTAVVIPLPPGAVVIGGAVDTTAAFDAATYNVTVGDTTDPDRYLTTTDVKAAGTTALVPTGYRGIGENIVLVFNAADVCTEGQATVRVEYVVADRSNEVQVA